MKEKQGLIHLYCGDGKGKTTAAMGLALRAVGHGFHAVSYTHLVVNAITLETLQESVTCLEQAGISGEIPACSKHVTDS